jgi:hypothetical protein
MSVGVPVLYLVSEARCACCSRLSTRCGVAFLLVWRARPSHATVLCACVCVWFRFGFCCGFVGPMSEGSEWPPQSGAVVRDAVRAVSETLV